MWLFKKKASQDDFIKLKTNVRKSFRNHKKDMKILNQKCEFLEKEINKVRPLSKRFIELQNQFTELLRQFTNGSLNCKNTKNTEIKSENNLKKEYDRNQIKYFIKYYIYKI